MFRGRRIIDHRFHFRDDPLHSVGLIIQFPAGETSFFRTGGGLLRHLLNLEQPGRNLYDTPGLFLGSGIHIRHHFTNLSGIFGDGANGGNDIVQFSGPSLEEETAAEIRAAVHDL
jgi:hypothetical protein